MRSESRWGSVKGGKRDRSTGGTEQEEEARAVMHSDIGVTHCCVMREEQNGFEEVAGNCNQKKEKKAGREAGCRRASSTQPSCHASYRSAAGGQAGSSAMAGCPWRASAQRL